MERAARIFAVRVLLLHVLAFVLLLILTGVGARNAYLRAQEQAIEQAGLRQQLVAQQTARGIENYFHSVQDNIRLLTGYELQNLQPLQPGGSPSDARGFGENHPPRRGGEPPAERNPARLFAGSVHKAVWKQIESRASHLIALRVDDARIIDSEQWTGVPAAESTLPALISVIRNGDDEGISNRMSVEGFDFSFIWVRFSPRNPVTVVAIIPLDRIGKQFIDPLNAAQKGLGGVLYDSETAVIRAIDSTLVGVNLEKETVSPGFKKLVGVQRARPMGGVEQIDNAEFVQGQFIERSIIAFEPIRLTEEAVWFVSIGSTLADAGGLVNEIFRGTLFWAPILLLVFTGVMVSTAITLIRSRSRLERFRHQMITKELAQARQIQLSWLPKARFQGRGLDVFAMNAPASHVSGDFYNYFPLRDGREAVVIGDVTGHGLAAAFLMATTQMLIRSTLLRTGDLAATVSEVNHELCNQAFSGQFVTLLLVVIDQESQSIEVVNAGHPPPILVDDGKTELLKTKPQLVLGVEGDTRYYVQRFPLPDIECTLLLYTDGIVECRNEAGDRFSMEKLRSQLEGASELPEELMTRVMQIVDSFRGGEPLGDDATAVAMRITSVPMAAEAGFAGARV